MKKYKARFTAEAVQVKNNNLYSLKQWVEENDCWAQVIEGRGILMDIGGATMVNIGSYIVKERDAFYVFTEDNFKRMFKEVKK